MKTEEVEARAKVYNDAMEVSGSHDQALEAVARAVRAQDAARGGTLTAEEIARLWDNANSPVRGDDDWKRMLRDALAHSAAQGRANAALTQEKDILKQGLEMVRAQGQHLSGLVTTLTQDRDRLLAQRQADGRAIHDALVWAHGWHGKTLPSPSRDVAELLREYEKARAELAKAQAERDDNARRARSMEDASCQHHEWFRSEKERADRAASALATLRQALQQCVSALDGLLGDSDSPDDERPGVKAMQTAMAALRATPAEHPDTDTKDKHKASPLCVRESGPAMWDVKRGAYGRTLACYGRGIGGRWWWHACREGAEEHIVGSKEEADRLAKKAAREVETLLGNSGPSGGGETECATAGCCRGRGHRGVCSGKVLLSRVLEREADASPTTPPDVAVIGGGVPHVCGTEGDECPKCHRPGEDSLTTPDVAAQLREADA